MICSCCNGVSLCEGLLISQEREFSVDVCVEGTQLGMNVPDERNE